MPRSKRDKEISLTKVKPKGREGKEKLVNDVRRSVDEYEHLIVFTVDAMRSIRLNELRKQFRADSRFFIGKNKVIAVALGRAAKDEYRQHLCKISSVLTGQCGIMMTNKNLKEVFSYLKDHSSPEYARSGNVVSQTVCLNSGPLPQFDFSLEPRLRKLGLPVCLKKGVIVLEQDYIICREGDKINADQAKLLELFQYKLATFQLRPICSWSKDGTVTAYATKEGTVKKRKRNKNKQ